MTLILKSVAPSLTSVETCEFQESRDHQDAFEQYKEEMSDLAETVEIATLDKEMAEEKVILTKEYVLDIY